jgi:hypothetical protein
MPAPLHAAKAQGQAPFAKYDERGRMVALVNLTTQETRTCARFVRVGAITRAEYDREGRPIEFWIRRASHRVERFFLDGEDLEAGDIKGTHTLLRKGARVRVVAYGCGASGAVQDVDQIEALP